MLCVLDAHDVSKHLKMTIMNVKDVAAQCVNVIKSGYYEESLRIICDMNVCTFNHTCIQDGEWWRVFKSALTQPDIHIYEHEQIKVE